MDRPLEPPELAHDLRSAAQTVFGNQLPRAQRFAAWLNGPGIERGLLGPRESQRIWPRHVLNCAVLSELIGDGESVVDVGSGAGLPGVTLALARPHNEVILLEPLLRRANFLAEVVADLELGNVTLLRSRAEDVGLQASVVTSRALAPLHRLARWSLPLATPGGRVLAIKGSGARAEAGEHAERVRALGGREVAVVHCGDGLLPESTTVITMTKAQSTTGRRRGPRAGRGRGGRT